MGAGIGGQKSEVRDRKSEDGGRSAPSRVKRGAPRDDWTARRVAEGQGFVRLMQVRPCQQTVTLRIID